MIDNQRLASPGGSWMDTALADADAAVSRTRAERSDADIVRALTDSALAWCARDYPPRAATVAALAASNRVAPAMVEASLDSIFGVVTADDIHELLRRDGDATRADAIRRRYGPRFVYFAAAGNLPGQAIPVLVCSALARSAAVIRDSVRQPELTRAFVQTIRANDPTLADTFVTIDGGRGDENERAAGRASTIELSGSDETLSSLSARYRRVSEAEIIEHGTRTSAAVVTPQADVRDAARAIATDLAIYEGRGCLSPHTVCVEGVAAHFVGELAGALTQLEVRWPRQRQTLSEEAARRAFIDDAELSALANEEQKILRGADDAWCVEFAPAARIITGPGHRCVRVVATADRRATLARLATSAAPLAGIAITGERSADVVAEFEAAGSTRICGVGELQRPPLYWSQDGRRRLAELLAAGAADAT